jgi:acyl-CoA synthetase (AMP-forming)/AMP-acid ligase II
MSTAHLLQASAHRHPGAPAVTDRRGTWRYGEFLARVAATAAWLRARPGVTPGARVAIAMENCAGFLQVLWGCWHAGLCAVPINAKLHPKEFAYILANSGATLCFASPALHGGIAAALESDTRMLEADDALVDRIAAGTPMAIEERAPADPAWLFYTSGTTGRPKGATQCHRNLLFLSHTYTADIDPLDERDTILHPAPLSHGSGAYSVPHVAHASHNVIPDSGHFEAGETLALIERYPNVSFFAAPTLVVRMLNDGSIGHARLDNLKTIAYGGAPMYVSDLERALEVFGPRLYQLFGQGESPMTITGLDKRSHALRDMPGHRERLASAGWARTGVEVRVVDEDDRDLPAGEVGEIITRSDCVMLGYWENPEANARALRGGWLHTGDLGALDDTGMLTLKDRSKDMIISGGTNIYPREIEDVLLGHAGVREAAVVGAPHPDWGEEVVAFVVAHPGAVVEAAALDTRCLEHIARFKRPKRYFFLEALPKNNYGKVLKTALREKLADGKVS